MTWTLAERLYHWFGQKFKQDDCVQIEIESDDRRVEVYATDVRLDYPASGSDRIDHPPYVVIEADDIYVEDRP